MKELYELKEHLIDELKNYSKRDLSSGSLDMIDKLAHATKNICKIIESSDDGNSGYYPYSSYKRDSMGRYSSNYSRGTLADKLRELMDEAPDDHTRMELKRMVEKM